LPSSSSFTGVGEEFCSRRTLNLEKRTVSIMVNRFENGSFVAVCEGEQKIGALTASLVPAGSGATSAPASALTVIPPPHPDMAFFLKLAAEQVSARCGGIALLSVSVRDVLNNNDAKAVLTAIMEAVDGRP